MRSIAIFLLISGGGLGARAALPAQEPPAAQEPVKPSPPPVPETEQVQEPQPSPPQPVTQVSVAGSMEPAQVKELLHRVWLAEYRVNDLLTDLHPERWKLSPEAGEDFNKLLEKLRNEMAALEQWRSQFENRVESAYLGFETYASLGAVLPELDSMARRISKYENSSLAARPCYRPKAFAPATAQSASFATLISRSRQESSLPCLARTVPENRH